MPLQNAGIVIDDGLAAARGRLVRCAQPDAAAFALLYRGRAFICIRLSGSEEGPVSMAQEVDLARDYRGHLVHVPIGYPISHTGQARDVAAEIERGLASGMDVVVHCVRGHDRTRFAVIAWQVTHGGLSIDKALKASNPYFDSIDHIIDAQHTHVLREYAAELGERG